MVHSLEALAYQGEDVGNNDFQLVKSSTVVVVLNKKLRQLLTMPVTATAHLSLDASHPVRTSALLSDPQVQQPHPARQLCTGSDFINQAPPTKSSWPPPARASLYSQPFQN